MQCMCPYAPYTLICTVSVEPRRGVALQMARANPNGTCHFKRGIPIQTGIHPFKTACANPNGITPYKQPPPFKPYNHPIGKCPFKTTSINHTAISPYLWRPFNTYDNRSPHPKNNPRIHYPGTIEMICLIKLPYSILSKYLYNSLSVERITVVVLSNVFSKVSMLLLKLYNSLALLDLS